MRAVGGEKNKPLSEFGVSGIGAWCEERGMREFNLPARGLRSRLATHGDSACNQAKAYVRMAKNPAEGVTGFAPANEMADVSAISGPRLQDLENA
jgi:hypothetical protein